MVGGCSWVVWLGAFVLSVSKLRAQWGPVLHTVMLRKCYVLETKGCSSPSLGYLSSETGMRDLCRKAGVMPQAARQPACIVNAQ